MEWLKQYRYPIIAGLIGVFLAYLIVSFGFFKTIFVLILGALGVAAGLYIQNNYIDK
jgi:small integral membrane protein